MISLHLSSSLSFLETMNNFVKCHLKVHYSSDLFNLFNFCMHICDTQQAANKLSSEQLKRNSINDNDATALKLIKWTKIHDCNGEIERECKRVHHITVNRYKTVLQHHQNGCLDSTKQFSVTVTNYLWMALPTFTIEIVVYLVRLGQAKKPRFYAIYLANDDDSHLKLYIMFIFHHSAPVDSFLFRLCTSFEPMYIVCISV